MNGNMYEPFYPPHTSSQLHFGQEPPPFPFGGHPEQKYALPNASSHHANRSAQSATSQIDHDHPPFSRVFVVCSKSHTSEDLRAAFHRFGCLEDVWIVRDKHTKENRGVAYVKFSKMSEATKAVEEMDGKTIGEDPKIIKAIIAQPKSSKSTDDFDDKSALTRLFICVPKGVSEETLRSHFSEFGDVEYVQVVKDKKTRESKGCGYVKFHRPYCTAMALENCDKMYRAVMAEPKSAKLKRESAQTETLYHHNGPPAFHSLPEYGSFGGNTEGFLPQPTSSSVYANSQVGYPEARSSGGVCNRLQVGLSVSVSQDQIARLFDLIPGMELCDLKKNFSTGESRGIACVVYNSVGSAIYAKEKLNGFEYPPGSKLIVKYAPDDDIAHSNPALSSTMAGPANTSSISAFDDGAVNQPGGLPYCTAALPPGQPLADPKADCAQRLFIVCHPTAPPDHALKDVFSRFGDLIDVYILKGKNFGYAKYSNADSANAAIEALHTQDILGRKLKVLPAEPPKTHEGARKRPRNT